jgi:hypothetical protein
MQLSRTSSSFDLIFVHVIVTTNELNWFELCFRKFQPSNFVMAGIDDNAAIIGDWVPPTPNTRSFFSAMLGDDIGSRPLSEPPSSNTTEDLFLGPPQPMMSGNNNGTQSGLSLDKFTDFDSFSEHKSSSRAGLVERMAARAGFNAPRLNTQGIRSADMSSNSDIRSPYLTIPPGLSPTTLLDSPVFLSNSLVSFKILKILFHCLVPFLAISVWSMRRYYQALEVYPQLLRMSLEPCCLYLHFFTSYATKQLFSFPFLLGNTNFDLP